MSCLGVAMRCVSRFNLRSLSVLLRASSSGASWGWPSQRLKRTVTYSYSTVHSYDATRLAHNYFIQYLLFTYCTVHEFSIWLKQVLYWFIFRRVILRAHSIICSFECKCIKPRVLWRRCVSNSTRIRVMLFFDTDSRSSLIQFQRAAPSVQNFYPKVLNSNNFRLIIEYSLYYFCTSTDVSFSLFPLHFFLRIYYFLSIILVLVHTVHAIVRCFQTRMLRYSNVWHDTVLCNTKTLRTEVILGYIFVPAVNTHICFSTAFGSTLSKTSMSTTIQYYLQISDWFINFICFESVTP